MCARACVCVRVCVCACVRVHECVRAYMYVCLSVCLPACLCLCISVCVCLCVLCITCTILHTQHTHTTHIHKCVCTIIMFYFCTGKSSMFHYHSKSNTLIQCTIYSQYFHKHCLIIPPKKLLCFILIIVYYCRDYLHLWKYPPCKKVCDYSIF